MPLGRLHELVGSGPLRYWKKRAQKYGERAVLNLGHRAEEFDAVGEFQRAEILPWLIHLLDGKEKLAVDFGCGPGRFSASLAELIPGQVIAVDPTESFLQMAPVHERVTYHQLDRGRLPLSTHSADLVWICLVLGGLAGRQLRRALSEIERALKPSGLLFVIENTSERPSPRHWHYRTVEEYKSLMPFADVAHLSNYEDLGETISIMAGRKISV